MDDIQSDPRFSHVTKDPRFRQVPRKERKVKIDKRFQSMFSDKRFKLKYSVDKRGRPVDTSTDENLKKYYELSSESSSSEDDEDVDDDIEKDHGKEDLHEKDDSGVDDESVKSSMSEDLEREEMELASKKIAKMQKSASGKSVSKLSSEQKHRETGRHRFNVQSHNEEDSDTSSSNDHTKNSSNRQQKNTIKSGSSASHNKDEKSSQVQESENRQKKTKSKQKKTVGKSKKELIDMATAPDLARGAVLLESSSEDEDLSDDEDGEFDHGWGELDKDVPEAEDLGHRLAICNMDWDRVKAHDLYLLFNSFVPTGGILHSIKIYPSEYGVQRMAEEERSGPVELTKQVEEPEPHEESQDGSRYHREKLRRYQLNRLKYYYAVADFDSVKTASRVYDECDGREFESSSSKLDLRYIPDGMKFEDKPKSECTSIAVAKYKPQNFYTSALCQSKVDLTWDETDRDRISVTMKKFQKEEINEDDFKAFLASDSDGEADYGDLVAASDDSDSDQSDEEKQIDKYKQLLQSLDDGKQTSKDNDMDMEITWEPGLKETAKDIVKKKERESGQTPWEEYLHKKKQKKKQLKEQKKSAAEKRERESQAHATEHGEAFSDDELPPGVDLNDPFFTDELKDSDKVKKKGQKKKNKRKDLTEEELAKQKQEQAELALLTMEENEEGKHHFNLNDLVQDKKKKKKKKHKNQVNVEVNDNFEIKVDDPRFNAMYNSHLFNIDPSAPEFKRTKGIEAIIEEKLKRRKHPEQTKSEFDVSENVTAKRRKHSSEQDGESFSRTELETSAKDVSLTSLVKSVKAKTQQFYSKKKFR
ncbi:ESF1 homolog isoform X2 [Gigantopelta aegis]|nr:ESF1 homolog isoform X2 [Gigantopelta aegis]